MSILLTLRSRPLRRLALRLAGTLSIIASLASCADSESGPPTAPPRIPVALVRIAPLEGPLVVGAEHPLQAVPLSASGAELTDRELTWESDNAAVATVSAIGRVTAHAPGTVGITASSEGKSSRLEVQIVSPNPVPVLTGRSPTSVAAGTEGPLVVTVIGTGFTGATRIFLDGEEQATEFVDDKTLRIRLATDAMSGAATLGITAATPAPGGGVSNALAFRIEDAPAPTIASLDPRQIVAGWGGAFTLNIDGTGFTPRSTVTFDGAPRTARFVNEGRMQITIEPRDVRVARIVPVVVETPGPGGGMAVATFAVQAIPVSRVTVQSPWGFAWTWRHHRLPLTAVAEDALGRELFDRQATWRVVDPFVATAVPLGEREVAVYGSVSGTTDVEAVVDGVRGLRTVRVHETPGYQLVYEAGEGDDRHLMLWDVATATAPRRLGTPMVAFAPSPSPDGREVAFAGVNAGAGSGGNVDIFIRASDGSTRVVAPSAAYDGDPAWSPDATRLAFTSARANGSLDVFVVELATGTLTRLTDANPVTPPRGSGMAARAPAWSPDGKALAYTVQTTTGSEVWAMAVDGTNKRQLTSSATADDFDPSWSPDGATIAFTREYRQPQPAVVMSVAPDGSNITPIGGRVVNVAATPAFSPDGVWVTTSETRGNGVGAIYAFSVGVNAGPRIVLPPALGGGRHARWMRRP